ncbi:hypothetical protein [Lachnospira multipara]|uniref:Uncharacterized protein n=1 Tax=Lachnospira multipara TaxID=28051 RepID=A0A1H5VQI8_9FIRM|nr:hypothetical protein [Lachnospira multipara]SEF89595.1 hypothetical protein SAMN05216537_11237 [Lachnospira multipara]
MRKNKLITTLLISTLALSSLLTACGTKKNTSENATELVTEATTDTLTSADGSSVEGIELEGLTFNSSEVEVTADMTTAITNAGLDGGYTTVKSFDLNMTDANNEKVQPNGTVSITKTLDKLNAPEGYTTEYRVYYYNPDTNTLEACNTTYEDNTVTFETTHFSVYMYFCVCFDVDKDVVTNVLTTDDGLKFYTASEYATYMIEQEERKAEEASAKAQAEAKAQASSSNSSPNVTTNSNDSNSYSSNEVANDTSNSVDTSSSDTSGSDSQYIKAIVLMDGSDVTNEWQLTWNELEKTKNPQIYFMRYSNGSPTAKGRFYVFNKDNTIARMVTASRFVPEDEGFEKAVASVWDTALFYGID